jgi:hypothetical protein
MAETKTLGEIAYGGFNTFKGHAVDWPLAKGCAVEEMNAWEAAAQAVRLKTIEECAKVAQDRVRDLTLDFQRNYPDDFRRLETMNAEAREIAQDIRALKDKSNDQG